MAKKYEIKQFATQMKEELSSKTFLDAMKSKSVLFFKVCIEYDVDNIDTRAYYSALGEFPTDSDITEVVSLSALSSFLELSLLKITLQEDGNYMDISKDFIYITVVALSDTPQIGGEYYDVTGTCESLVYKVQLGGM